MSVRSLVTAARTFAVLNGGNPATVLQLDAVAPYDSTVGIRFNTDGTVETGKSKNGDSLVWSSAGTWIEPTSSADSSHSVRYTNKGVGEDFTTKAAIEDTWIGLGSRRTWLMNSTSQEEIDFSCDFEVRKTAGAPPATGSSSYTFDIDNTA